MKFFKFSWLNSKERQQLQDLLKEKERREWKEAEEKKQSDAMLDRFKTTPITYIQSTPFKSLRLIGSTTIVVLHDGTSLSGTASLFVKVKSAKSEEEIIALFVPDPELEVNMAEVETSKERKLVRDNWRILETNKDFTIKGDEIYLDKVDLPMPAAVVSSFIEILERKEYFSMKSSVADGDSEDLNDLEDKYQALRMFWYWTALNPIESSRNDLLNFVKKNDIKITFNGLLEMYRNVVSTGKGNKELIKFVSEQYFKIKRWKKSPSAYDVWKGLEGDGYSVLLVGKAPSDEDETYELVGNLEKLYLDLPNLKENTYTDAHTRKKSIKVGEVYKEDEDKIDLDNSRNCSSGLHVGSSTFLFDGFGDTGVLALVNPMKVRSVPTSETNKMRVSEMFICAVIDLAEYKDHVNSSDINDFSQEYFAASVEELEGQLKNKRFDKLVCQDNAPSISMANIQEITEQLKSRIVNI